MKKLSRLLATIDENVLKVFLFFFVFLIPLFPKLPLKSIGYTYISIRLDDLLVTAISLIFLIQLIRKKVSLNRKFLILFGIFWLAVFASFVWSVFIVETMPYRQVAMLHALRRLEYMIVFFIAMSAVRSKRDFFQLLLALILSTSLIIGYAFGQKFVGFPAVQTMNPAFSRGEILLLTPEARISGTFGGHYDLAAYLVFLIPILLGLYFVKEKIQLALREKYIIYIIGLLALIYTAFNFRVNNEWIIISGTAIPFVLFFFSRKTIQEKLILFLLAISSIYVLIFTASRISFLAYIVSTPLLLLFMRKYKYFVLIVGITLLMFFTSKDLANRFAKTFQVKQILVNDQTGQVFVPQTITSKELPAGSAYYGLSGGGTISDETAKYKDKVIKETLNNPDLSKKEKDKLLASLSANIQARSGVVADISFATRLQVEWPRAVAAFMRNPLLGTGPFSITEATDNDYLRWLGEFGLFGFLSFMFLLANLVWFIFSEARKQDKAIQPLFYGVIFGLGGLMINAGYIDVFEASKVAYILWFTTGIFVGFLSLHPKKT